MAEDGIGDRLWYAGMVVSVQYDGMDMRCGSKNEGDRVDGRNCV